jgi:hypothetical protein
MLVLKQKRSEVLMTPVQIIYARWIFPEVRPYCMNIAWKTTVVNDDGELTADHRSRCSQRDHPQYKDGRERPE